MSDSLLLLYKLIHNFCNYLSSFWILWIFIFIFTNQIYLGNGEGENCQQKGLGPQDLYQNGVMNTRYSWYKVGRKIQVPIVLDSAYSYRERNTILGGLGEIQDKTCVEFYIFNHTGLLQGYDYVYITKQKSGCWSYVGRVGGGQQEMSLARGCINHRTAVHEMIHALGFTHEHVRSDRDKYVRINWGNIMEGRERNFVKRTKGSDAYGPYDYGSIMHYDRRAFSLNREDTIVPLKHPGAKIGLGQTMSYWDVKRILHMYKCGDGYGEYDYSGGGGGGSNHLDIGSEYDDVHRIQDNHPHNNNNEHQNQQQQHPHHPHQQQHQEEQHEPQSHAHQHQYFPTSHQTLHHQQHSPIYNHHENENHGESEPHFINFDFDYK